MLVEHTGEVSNDKNCAAAGTNRAITPLGRSRGGLSTKIHAAVDGRGRPLSPKKTPLSGASLIAGAGFEHISPTLAYRFVETIELP